MRSIATRFPENSAGTELEKLAVSLALASTWTRKTQFLSFPKTETANDATIRLAKMDFITD
jgi:hypothetical protein